MEPRYSRLQAILKGLNIRSTCALPLTTAHRKLGGITFCSEEVDTYSANDIRFVSQVADYIALAFDDALAFTSFRLAPGRRPWQNHPPRASLRASDARCSTIARSR